MQKPVQELVKENIVGCAIFLLLLGAISLAAGGGMLSAEYKKQEREDLRTIFLSRSGAQDFQLRTPNITLEVSKSSYEPIKVTLDIKSVMSDNTEGLIALEPKPNTIVYIQKDNRDNFNIPFGVVSSAQPVDIFKETTSSASGGADIVQYFIKLKVEIFVTKEDLLSDREQLSTIVEAVRKFKIGEHEFEKITS
ncbi:MAG: hypothetical protein AAFY57_10840 [Cyanobacteria bacterium J06642_2]